VLDSYKFVGSANAEERFAGAMMITVILVMSNVMSNVCIRFQTSLKWMVLGACQDLSEVYIYFNVFMI